MKKVTKDNVDILEALCIMWEQSEIVLEEYGLLNGKGEINWDLFPQDRV